MKHMKILRVAVVGFALLAVTVLAGGIALAAPGPGRDGDGGGNPPDRQRANLTLTNVDTSGENPTATAEVELRLESGVLEARAKGEGFNEGAFSLCIEGAFGVLFIEDDDAEADGTLEIDEVLDGGLPFVTLEDQMVRIRVGDEGVNSDCDGPVVLERLIEAQDIE